MDKSGKKEAWMCPSFQHIPANIVTGFLGAGKTTAINHLLSAKPTGERWAVLVNEFGKIGIDAAMLGARTGVSIAEVSGGCLCCTAGQAFEVALNRLIRKTTPHRILVEPTGIGHPMKIIRTLSGGYYSEVLDLRATITLVDARKLHDSRYREHSSFQDQIRVADVLVANKSESYNEADRQAFFDILHSSHPPKSAHAFVSFGQLDAALLDFPRLNASMEVTHDTHPAYANPLFSLGKEIAYDEPEPVSSDEWRVHEGSGKGYYSGSWLIGSDYQFDRAKLSLLLDSLSCARVKGIMHCLDGWLKVNGGDGELHFSECEPLKSSRLELMALSPLDYAETERKLRTALIASP